MMATENRKLLVLEGDKAFPQQLREQLTRAGWTLDVHPAAREVEVKEGEYRTILIDLLHGPTAGIRAAEKLRMRDEFRGMPIFFLGGNNEAIHSIKQDVPYSCFIEPSTIETSLQWFLPPTPGRG